jgi:transcriptional regulator with XRE-family HTH domain
MADNHEGQRLAELLEQVGVSQAQFSKAANVSQQMVSTYVRTPHFKPGALDTVRKGLVAVGADVDQLRPVAAKMQRVKARVEDLRPRVEAFKSRKQVEDLLYVLRADDAARDLLQAILEERLKFLS